MVIMYEMLVRGSGSGRLYEGPGRSRSCNKSPKWIQKQKGGDMQEPNGAWHLLFL